MLVSLSMESHYNLQFDLFLKEFSGYSKAVNYVRTSWLNPNKDIVVAALIDRFLHFGNTTTNGYMHACNLTKFWNSFFFSITCN